MTAVTLYAGLILKISLLSKMCLYQAQAVLLGPALELGSVLYNFTLINSVVEVERRFALITKS